MSKLIARAAKSGGRIAAQQLLSGLESLGRTYFEYHALRERERTARSQIEANRDVSIEAIRAQRDVLLKAIKGAVDIRKTGIQAQMKALDRAIEKGDAETVRITLACMVDLVKSSPFKDVAEMHAQMSDPGFTLKLK